LDTTVRRRADVQSELATKVESRSAIAGPRALSVRVPRLRREDDDDDDDDDDKPLVRTNERASKQTGRRVNGRALRVSP